MEEMRSLIGQRNNGLTPRLRPRSFVENGAASASSISNSKSMNQDIQRWTDTIDDLASAAERDIERAVGSHEVLRTELNSLAGEAKEVNLGFVDLAAVSRRS